MIELLSPAGNMESLKAAIMGGCDAVYLGGTLFGARAFANNFNDEEIINAINYAHLYGVKVYVTTNILIYEHEVDKFLKYIEFLHKNNVDAIIIQDLGMLDLVHKTFPNLEIHASTQMHIHNLDGVIIAKKLGVKRVVLARETPIEVIENVKKQVDIDLEIFAHGALCVSYSGQCLFSSLIGNRSGNRGSCVGSCRLPYKIIDENNNQLNKGNYPLSMKDLNTLEYVGQLIDNGVTSLKIEGRMKSPEYVYTVTKLYRLAINSYYKSKKVIIDNNELINLQKIFSRGFTKGFLFHEQSSNILNSMRPNHQGLEIGKVIKYENGYVDIKLNDKVSINDGIRIIGEDDYGFILNDFYINHKLVKEAFCGDIISVKVNTLVKVNSKVLITKDSRLQDKIMKEINENKRKVLINGMVYLNLDKPLTIMLDDGINKVKVVGNIVEKSINNPITEEIVREKINKLGDSIYSFDKLDICIDSNVFIPIKCFNDLRREAISKLNDMREYHTNFVKNTYDIKVNDFPKEKLRSVLTYNHKYTNYDVIYGIDIIKVPKVIDNYLEYDINKEYLVGELGAFNKLKNIYCDYSFNVTNSYTVALLHSLGAKRITLSYELTNKQIENIIEAYHNRYHKHPNLEVVIYGYREVMCIKTNLTEIYGNKKISLVDRFNNKYLIRLYRGINYIYDYKLLDNRNNNYYAMGINALRENRELE